MGWSKAEGLADMWEGEMRACRVAGMRLLIIKQAGAVRAYADRCAHLGMPLSEGRFRDGVITCRSHEFTYDAATGSGINPGNVRLQPFAAKCEEGEIWVDLGTEA